MIPGAPVESRWLRSEPRLDWPVALLTSMVHCSFPAARVSDVRAFTQGRRNANFRLLVSGRTRPVVLRIYQHDASLCQKEVDIMRLVKQFVPVPEIIYAQAEQSPEFPPFIVMEYVEGISFRELMKTGDAQAIAEAARSAGETLAVIGSIHFEQSGWLGPGPFPTAPLLSGENPVPRFIDACLATPILQTRVPIELCERIHELAWASQAIYDEIDDCSLVHGDFNKRNLLVRQVSGQWRIAAVLDWEFAIAASPLGDFGNLLRYEKKSRPILEPHFSASYLAAGGRLPANWLRLARLLDLIALCESLTRAVLPKDVERELIELVRSTVEDRDPHID